MKKVGIIMGSKSDLPVIEKAVSVLKAFDIPYEVHVYSAHRTPEQSKEFAQTARENGFGVIIAAAGKAAHLAGVLAAHTTLPVLLPQTLRFRSSEFPAVRKTSAVSMLFFQLFRCHLEFLSLQSP